MCEHPNMAQSGGDTPVPSSGPHQTFPLGLKDLFFHRDQILGSIPTKAPQGGNFFSQEHPMHGRGQELLASHQPCPHRFPAPSKGLSPLNHLLPCSAGHPAPLPCLAFTSEENLWGPRHSKVGAQCTHLPAQSSEPCTATTCRHDGSARCWKALFVLRISFINPREASGGLGWKRLRRPAASIAMGLGGGQSPPAPPAAAVAPSCPAVAGRSILSGISALTLLAIPRLLLPLLCFGWRHPLTNF